MRLRIAFFGGGAQAAAALGSLVRHHDVVLVHPRFGRDDEICGFGLPVLDHANVNSDAALADISAATPDLIVSVNAKQIFRAPLLAIPPLGAINLHNGLLPRQRGGGGGCIGLINGEPCGCTVHVIDTGIDSGDIVLQRTFDLPPEPTMADFDAEAIRLAPDAILRAVDSIAAGAARPRPQTGPWYYVPAKPEWAELIDWSLPSADILRRIRARTPGPGGTYLYGDKLHRVLHAEEAADMAPHTNAPGQVIGRGDGVLVKTGDTGIWLRRVEAVDGSEPATPRLGDMLAVNVHKALHDMSQRLSEIERRLDAMI